MFGNVWNLWECMEMYGNVWKCMEMYGNAWKYIPFTEMCANV